MKVGAKGEKAPHLMLSPIILPFFEFFVPLCDTLKRYSFQAGRVKLFWILFTRPAISSAYHHVLNIIQMERQQNVREYQWPLWKPWPGGNRSFLPGMLVSLNWWRKFLQKKGMPGSYRTRSVIFWTILENGRKWGKETKQQFQRNIQKVMSRFWLRYSGNGKILLLVWSGWFRKNNPFKGG